MGRACSGGGVLPSLGDDVMGYQLDRADGTSSVFRTAREALAALTTETTGIWAYNPGTVDGDRSLTREELASLAEQERGADVVRRGRLSAVLPEEIPSRSRTASEPEARMLVENRATDAEAADFFAFLAAHTRELLGRAIEAAPPSLVVSVDDLSGALLRAATARAGWWPRNLAIISTTS